MKKALVFVFLILVLKLNAQIKINEVLAINSSVLSDPDFGEFSDYIELHNTSSFPVNLQNYSLTDDPNTVEKWVMPSVILSPNHYLTVWADGRNKKPGEVAYSDFKKATITITGLHANFNVSSLGETIFIYDAQQQPVDSVKLSVQENDISIGRNILNTSEWNYFSEPTPGKINSTFGSTSLNYSAEPLFSKDEGFYSSSQQLQFNSPNPNAIIRFTFDGTTPTENSPILSGSFNIIRNYVIKARAYETGKLPSKVVTKTYFLNETINLPVVSISTENSNFYDFDFGILQNAMKDREVPVYIEYFDISGQRKFAIGAGAKLFGTSIFNLPQRPISIEFKSKFGDDKINYKLFNDRENTSYYSFLLRNGGNDYNLSYFREGLSTSLIKNKMDLDYQEYQPCVVFINGEYNGLYELRERLDEDYISNNNYISNANLDYLQDSLNVISGSKDNYQNLIHFIKNNDLSVDTNYHYVQQQIDINEFTNYIIHKIFIGYWIVDNNNKYWKDNDTESKWRWIANDNEHAFGKISGDNYMDNTLSKVSGNSGSLPGWSTFLFSNLLNNGKFKNEFIQRFATYLNTIFDPAVTISITDSLRALLSPQMPRHINEWNTPSSISSWHSNIDFIKTFLQNRSGYVRQHIASQFGIQDSAFVQINISGGGHVTFSGVLLEDTVTSGYYFKNVPITIHATPKPGYKFIEWQGLSITSIEATFTPLDSTNITAVFAPFAISIIPPLIQNDTVLSASLSPWYGIENVIIKPGARLTVEADVEIYMGEGTSIYVEGGLKMDGNLGNLISIQSDTLHSTKKDKSTIRWGSIIAENPSDSIIIKYVKINDGSFGSDRGRNFSTISVYNSIIQFEHSSISNSGPPFYAEGGNVYIANSTFYTCNRCNGFVSIHNVNSATIENCTFKGNKAADTDAIDLKLVTNAMVRNNHIYDFTGSNCDGIDLGINSTNNFIENNVIHNCTDKGISIGSQSNATISRNVIYDCDMGIGIKDSLAIAYLNQNTFYRNNYSVAGYEKSALRGGGKAYIQNSILAGSVFETVFVDDKSEVEINYSLSDKELLAGNNNIFNDPKFLHATTGNLQLHNTSPCINAGDPLLPYDPDNTIADVGAYYTFNGSYGLTVHINEINYHSAFNFNTGDWIELHNRTNQPVDIGGWKLVTFQNKFSIKQSTIIQPGEYLVICADTLLFKSLFPGVNKFAGNLKFELDNKSEKIYLYDQNSKLIHSIRYSDSSPWPGLADGKGATIELDETKEGNLIHEWHESYLLMGTPGAKNSTPPDVSGLYINEVMAANNGTIADNFNEYDDWFEVYNSANSPINIGGLYVTDQLLNKNKHQFPLNYPVLTTIPAKGFNIFWVDNQTEQGAQHVDFKLDASGEAFGIYQRSLEDYIVVDSLSFGAQINNTTWGRYPDGGTELYFLQPTPSQSNRLRVIPDSSIETILVSPNPAKSEITLKASSYLIGSDYSILNTLGKKILTGKIESESTIINLSGLSIGLYFVNVHQVKPIKLVKY
ncbi:MAG: CotH kinase family protein [Bacteroidia bacterium]|nr:CotH kinase family protein [Bacteroidia bacterium]